jgi:hypothetical protein
MQNNEILWGVGSILLATIQYGSYFKGIFSGKVKPHAFTWLVWGIQSGTTFFAQLVKNAGPGTWVTGYTTVFCVFIFALALSRGEKKIVKLDWAALVCALFSIVLWVVTQDPLIAVILATSAGALGWIPTVRKSIHKPNEESLTAYNIACMKWVSATVAVTSISWTTLLYPASSAIMTFMFIVMVLIRRAQLKGAI